MRAAGALAAFVAGAWFLQQQPALPEPGVLVVLGLLSAATLWVCLAIMRRHRWVPGSAAASWPSYCALLVAACTLGAVHAALLAHWQLSDELAFDDERRDVTLTGVIASLPAQLLRGTRFEFDVRSVETPGLHVPSHISLGWYSGGVRVHPGELWRFTVRLRRPHGALNPGGFDLEAWMLERGLRASGSVRDNPSAPPERLADRVANPVYLIDRLRDNLRERLQGQLQDARYGGVLVALVLGDQRAIREEDWLLFNRTGISHLVSISGLHITMIAGLVAGLVRWLWRRSPRALVLAPAQFAAACAAMLGALGYCLLAGWGVPAQRTFFMLATVAAALLLHLRTRPATTLALAASVVTVLDPWAVLAPGFWLSFGAVAAIFFALHGRPRPTAHWRRHLVEAVRTQWVVTLALVPLTVVLFQQVSLIAPLANAVAIPLVSLVVTPLALLAACFVALPEPFLSLAAWLLALAHTLMLWLAGLLAAGAQFPAATVTVAAPPPWAAALAVAGVAWMLAPPGWPVRWVGLTWMLPLWLWPADRPRDGDLWVTALDVGQGTSVVVEGARWVLVYDAGPRYSPQADAGSRIVAPYLRWRGIGRIDTLLLSHLDSDHSGGAGALLKSFDVARVWTSIDPVSPLLAGAKSVRRCEGGQAEMFDGTLVRLLNPSSMEYALPARNTNARSCVAEVHLAPWTVLLTGDLPSAQERAVLARAPPRVADLMLAPHHGSRTSSSEPFLRVVAPTWVAVQAGYRNRFGHPDPAVVARYGAVGARVVRTDEAGAVQWRFQSDGSVLVRRQRIDARRYWYNQPGSMVADATAPRTDETDKVDEDAPMPADAAPDAAVDAGE